MLMKKILFLTTMLLMSMPAMRAGWTPSDTDFRIVGQDSVYGQTGIKSIKTPDGNTVITWLISKNETFNLYMQIFDSDGHEKLPKEGILVCDQPTMSWVTDYGMALASNGDLVIAYNDARNDARRQTTEAYVYRYNQQGQPVWPKDGIRFQALQTHANAQTCSSLAPQVSVSGDNIYVGVSHTELYTEKADSTNWEPTPWNPEMPDSVSIEYRDFQVQLLRDNGTFSWEQASRFDFSVAWLSPAPGGNTYVVYGSAGMGLDAVMVGHDGRNQWGGVAHIESNPLSISAFVPTPVIESDGQGGLMLVYRRLTATTGYIVMNRLQPDGSVYDEAVNCNGTTDGDAQKTVLGACGGKALVMWNYEDKQGVKNLMVNQLGIDGSYAWSGDRLLGYSLGQNETWGFNPVKVIPQEDGWVLLYGNVQSWDGANFVCEKLDRNGSKLWSRQLLEDNCKTEGLNVCYDQENAYIFYTCSQEIDDTWEPIPGPGGLRLLVVKIGEGQNPSGMGDLNVTHGEKIIYNVQGMRVGNMATPGIYIVKTSEGVKKVLVR